MNTKKERGSALIAVLFLIFTGGIITTMVLSLSQTGSFSVAAHVERQRSMLVAEGAAARIRWLLAADWALYPEELLGETDYEQYEFDRFLCDSVIHVMDYYGEKIRFQVNDAISGDDLFSDADNCFARLVSPEDTTEDLKEQVERVLTRFSDYTDSDDEAGEESFESEDYEDFYLKPLPRNEAMYFREEWRYIPEFSALYSPDRFGRLSSVRLIPPTGSPSLKGVPSLFSADARMIRNYCGIDDDEVIADAVKALEEWKCNRVPLSESLDEEVVAKLKSGLSTRESGYFTVHIGPADESPRPFARLTFTYEGFSVSGPPNRNVEYMEWQFY